MTDKAYAWWGFMALLATNTLAAATVYAGAAGNQWKPALTTFLLGLTVVALLAACLLFLAVDDDEDDKPT